jgi:hypothetical protein
MPFDFSAVTAPFRMQPGLRRLAPGVTQLTPSTPQSAALAEKLSVLTHHPRRALLAVPGFDSGAAVGALARHAGAEHPLVFAWDGAQHWQALRLGWSVRGPRVDGEGPAAIGQCLRALPEAWRAAALLALAFEEDFAVIDGASATVPWLAVCLPSHWAPELKLGLHFAQVHAPVADNATLLAAGEHLARLVSGSQRWERHVWTVTPHAALCQHPLAVEPRSWPQDGDAAALAARAHLRTERQTFIPTGTGQAVFTIHVEVQALAQAVQTAEQAWQLHAALLSMSPAVLAYRGLTQAQPRLLAWLASHGASPRSAAMSQERPR